jgi:TPR repeat protein
VGKAVPQDSEEAAKYFLAAADAGHAEAQLRLAEIYEHGDGVQRDVAEAGYYYRLALKQGRMTAANNLGEMLIADAWEQDSLDNHWQEACDYFRLAAVNDHRDAQYNLAEALITEAHKQACAVDPEKLSDAVMWFKRAADNGHIQAQCNMGSLCNQGKGTVRDVRESTKYYRMAAEQGNVTAQYALAWRVFKGEGVNGDVTTALHWLTCAAAQGHQEAAKALTQSEQMIRMFQASVPKRLQSPRRVPKPQQPRPEQPQAISQVRPQLPPPQINGAIASTIYRVELDSTARSEPDVLTGAVYQFAAGEMIEGFAIVQDSLHRDWARCSQGWIKMMENGDPVLRPLPSNWETLEEEVRMQVEAQAQARIASEVADRVKVAARQAATAAAVAAKAEVESLLKCIGQEESDKRIAAEGAAREAKIQADKALRAAAEIAAAAEAERIKRKEAEAEMHAERKARLIAERQVSRTTDAYADLESKFHAFVSKVQGQTQREVRAAVVAAEARANETTERRLHETLEAQLRAEAMTHAQTSAKAFESVAAIAASAEAERSKREVAEYNMRAEASARRAAERTSQEALDAVQQLEIQMETQMKSHLHSSAVAGQQVNHCVRGVIKRDCSCAISLALIEFFLCTIFRRCDADMRPSRGCCGDANRRGAKNEQGVD